MCRFLLACIATLCFAELQAPFNLRAGGSNFDEPALAFALSPSRPVVFRWAAEHPVPGASQLAYQVVVTKGEKEIWSSGKVLSSRPSCVYTGPSLAKGSYRWKVNYWDQESSQSENSAWATFHIAPEDWESNVMINWLGSDTDNLYRAEYTVPFGTYDVLAYVCGLGYSTVTVDGAPVNDQVLVTAPWTNNERFNAFSTFLLPSNPGRHAIGVQLGNGWRDTGAFPNQDHDQGTDTIQRVLRAQIFAISSNGTETLLTYTGDANWRSSPGPALSDSVYDGETYDARIAAKLQGWDTVGGGAGWKAAANVTGPSGDMTPWSVQPVKVDFIRRPVAVTNPQQGIYVVDFGSNLAGVVKLKGITCAAGSNITLRHAEIMQHAGLPDVPNPDPRMIYVGNLRSAKATDVYICSGISPETWKPSLTYHGFRFVEVNVQGAAGVVITADNIEQHHFHSALPQRAFVKFPSDTLNMLQTMALGAQRSNLMSLPTDCDQRDERLGWMGDANLSGDSILLNFDAAAFIEFFMNTIESETNADGSIPDVVPFMRYGGRPADVSWSAAYANLAFCLWAIDGDITFLNLQLPTLMSQLANVQAQAAQGVDKMHTPYGDWCPPPASIGGGQGPKPSEPYTSAFSYLFMVQQLQGLAGGPLANVTLAAQLAQLAQNVTNSFNTAFYKGEGAYDSVRTQTALALALALGISPDPTSTAGLLVQDLTLRSTHYTTGIIGFKALLPALSAAGKGDLAMSLLQQTDYPSIGYYFANNMEPASENLWELPDALGEGTGMNSRNHHMWSSYSGYLVKQAAGLSPVAPGELLMTAATNQLGGAEVLLKLPEGDAFLKWQRTGGVQFDKASENHSLRLDCGKGSIEEVLFASFGTPFMNGDSMEIDESCHSSVSKAQLVSLCVNRTSCVVPASHSLFATECRSRSVARPLKLWASVQCSTQSELVVQATVPLTSVAELRMPVLPNTQLTQDGKSLLSANMPAGVKSISYSGSESAKFVSIQLGSGSFNFGLSMQ